MEIRTGTLAMLLGWISSLGSQTNYPGLAHFYLTKYVWSRRGFICNCIIKITGSLWVERKHYKADKLSAHNTEIKQKPQGAQPNNILRMTKQTALDFTKIST